MSPVVLDRPTLFDGPAAGPAALRERAMPARAPRRRAAPVERVLPADRTAAPATPVATPSAGAASAPRTRLGDGGPTLEGVIAGAWEGLVAHHEVGCPLCGGQMQPRYGAAGVAPVGGRCTDCGTTLG